MTLVTTRSIIACELVLVQFWFWEFHLWHRYMCTRYRSGVLCFRLQADCWYWDSNTPDKFNHRPSPEPMLLGRRCFKRRCKFRWFAVLVGLASCTIYIKYTGLLFQIYQFIVQFIYAQTTLHCYEDWIIILRRYLHNRCSNNQRILNFKCRVFSSNRNS